MATLAAGTAVAAAGGGAVAVAVAGGGAAGGAGGGGGLCDAVSIVQSIQGNDNTCDAWLTQSCAVGVVMFGQMEVAADLPSVRQLSGDAPLSEADRVH